MVKGTGKEADLPATPKVPGSPFSCDFRVIAYTFRFLFLTTGACFCVTPICVTPKVFRDRGQPYWDLGTIGAIGAWHFKSGKAIYLDLFFRYI